MICRYLTRLQVGDVGGSCITVLMACRRSLIATCRLWFNASSLDAITVTKGIDVRRLGPEGVFSGDQCI
jgi:hypothetical protein